MSPAGRAHPGERVEQPRHDIRAGRAFQRRAGRHDELRISGAEGVDVDGIGIVADQRRQASYRGLPNIPVLIGSEGEKRLDRLHPLGGPGGVHADLPGGVLGEDIDSRPNRRGIDGRQRHNRVCRPVPAGLHTRSTRRQLVCEGFQHRRSAAQWALGEPVDGLEHYVQIAVFERA